MNHYLKLSFVSLILAFLFIILIMAIASHGVCVDDCGVDPEEIFEQYQGKLFSQEELEEQAAVAEEVWHKKLQDEKRNASDLDIFLDMIRVSLEQSKYYFFALVALVPLAFKKKDYSLNVVLAFPALIFLLTDMKILDLLSLIIILNTGLLIARKLPIARIEKL